MGNENQRPSQCKDEVEIEKVMDLEEAFNCISLHTPTKDYNQYFCANACHVCKGFGDGVPLQRCFMCGMIAYCGWEHQVQHWTQHESLCKAIRYVMQGNTILSPGHNVTSKEWTENMRTVIEQVSSKLERPLVGYEMEMFMFLRKCAVCHKWQGQLMDCQNCFSVSFCKDHEDYKDSPEHKVHCDALKVHFYCALPANDKWFIGKDNLICVDNTQTFDNMSHYVNTVLSWYVNAKMNDSRCMSDMLINTANHSEFLNHSLTVYYAMQILDYVSKRKDFIIHVIVANTRDEYGAPAWEVLLHLTQATSVLIIMIGTVISHSKEIQSNLCENCISERKNFSLEFHNLSYEEYASSLLFEKPDLVIGFNVDFKKSELAGTRGPCVKLLSKQNCPLILTSGTNTLGQEVNEINAILGRKIDYLYNGLNRFASLMPMRKPFSEEVWYNSFFLLIYRNLCV